MHEAFWQEMDRAAAAHRDVAVTPQPPVKRKAPNMTHARRITIFTIVATMAGCGCAAPDAEFATRVKAHVDPMKQVYERGVATYPNATDQAIYRQQMVQLDRLLDAGGAK